MEHVRIGHHDLGLSPDSCAVRRWRVAVIYAVTDFALVRDQRCQLGCLILGQSLGRVEVERSRRAVIKNCFDNGQVVAHAFAAGGGSCHYDVLALSQGVNRINLVSIQGIHSLGFEPGRDSLVEGRVNLR